MTAGTPEDDRPTDTGNSGSAPDRGEFIRSEERLGVHTEPMLAGYARLEKFVVTETKTITVQVSHEEVRLVHAGPDEHTVDHRPHAGPDGEADPGRWLMLSREEVTVVKTVVPVERVRLETFPVTEQRTLTDHVRKEQIDTVTVDDRTGSPTAG